jgi:hypothetical protein
MKTRSIFFALAISSCSAVPAFAQNAIVSASIDATPLSLNGVNYPAVTITPGTTANGSAIAVGNITPLQYRGALGFTNGPPECILQFQDDGAGVSPSSITQAPNGDWQGSCPRGWCKSGSGFALSAGLAGLVRLPRRAA